MTDVVVRKLVTLMTVKVDKTSIKAVDTSINTVKANLRSLSREAGESLKGLRGMAREARQLATAVKGAKFPKMPVRSAGKPTREFGAILPAGQRPSTSQLPAPTRARTAPRVSVNVGAAARRAAGAVSAGVGAAARGLGGAAREVVTRVRAAVDSASFDRASSAVDRIAERAMHASQAADNMKSAFLGMAKGIGHAAMEAGTFEQDLVAVSGVIGATESEMQALKEAAVQAGLETQFSPTEAVKGLSTLATAGLNATQSIEALGPVLKLSQASLGKLDIERAGTAIIGTMNAYSMSADKAGEVADKLFRITQMTGFQMNDFETALSKAAATGGAFGQDLESVIVGVGALRNANIDASSAGTALRESISRLGAEQRAQTAMRQAGVKIFDKESNKMRDILELVIDFNEKTKNMDVEERGKLMVAAFGKRGLALVNAVKQARVEVMEDGNKVVKTGADAIRYMKEQELQARGSLQKFQDLVQNTFKGQFTLLKGSIETLIIGIGEPFLQVLKPAVEAVISTINKAIKKWQGLSDSFKRRAAIVAALATAFVGAASGIASLTVAFRALSMAASVANAKVLLIPAALAGIALFLDDLNVWLRGGESLIGDFIDKFKEADSPLGMLARSLEAAKPGLQALRQGAIDLATKAIPLIKAAFDKVKSVAKTVFDNSVRALAKFIDFIREHGAEIWSAFKALMKRAWKSLVDLFDRVKATAKKAYEPIKALFLKIVETAKPILKELMSALGEIFRAVADYLGTMIEVGARVFARLQPYISKVFDYIKSNGPGAIQTVKDAILLVIGAFKTLLLKAEGVFNWIMDKLESDKSLWTQFKEWLGGIWEDIKESIKTKITGAVNKIGKALFDMWKAVKDFAVEKWEALKTNVVDKATKAATKVKEAFGNLWGNITKAADKTWDGIVSSAGKIWDRIKGTFTNTVDKAANIFKDAWLAVSKTVEESFKRIYNWFAEKVESLPMVKLGNALGVTDIRAESLLDREGAARVFAGLGLGRANAQAAMGGTSTTSTRDNSVRVDQISVSVTAGDSPRETGQNIAIAAWDEIVRRNASRDY